MRLIPVIDLKEGVAVHARRGQRDAYQALSPNADVFAVIDTFLQGYDFKVIYLADLNAIMGRGDNTALIERVLRHYPTIEFWLDCGLPIRLDLPNYLPVLGSECCDVAMLTDFARPFVLSLDFSPEDKPLGDARLFVEAALWSRRVIIMTLARVGSESGADIDKLRYYRAAFPEPEFIASGGVRNVDDLQRLKAIDINTVLIASALHSGTISKADIDNL